MNVNDICRILEDIAPSSLAADWDNVGLLVGDGNAKVRRLLLCIDLTAEVLDEALAAKAQMVMAYHPVIFKAVKRVTAEAAPVVYRAARRGVAVYSMHTALDVAAGGTNDVLAEALGLSDCRPVETLTDETCKVVTFLPHEDLSAVADAAFANGAGIIGDYGECSFFSHGIGTFRGGEQTNPAVGETGRHEAVEENRLEMVAPRSKLTAVCEAIRSEHSYEEPPIDVYPLIGVGGSLGMGRVGRLDRPTKLSTLVARLKKTLGLTAVLQAGPADDRLVGAAAVAAGSCGSMWRGAAAAGATLYVTGEMRHHDALAAAAAQLSVICLGHSNSERITLRRLADRLGQAAGKLDVALSTADRDPFTII
ncbi:MAG: Nif3-like dinuclear metal center hexameric protein [Planctomycetes bacterium]|jgi:dinuclear metal center YbgI/SA1388 family protein|nr:Nif3-like dinuclear metal center hexameric protein [Planctomycetota bacterium]